MGKYKLYLFLACAILTVVMSVTLIQYAGTAQGATFSPIAADLSANTEEVYVPAGAFGMGCAYDLAPATCDSDAMPLHLVYLDAYYIDKVPVTNQQYAACEAAGVCPRPLSRSSRTRPYYYQNPDYNSYPMINVEWEHADAYCRWVGKRLPTEAEWEKAARGTDLRTFPWGNQLPNCELSNIAILQPINDAVSDGYPHPCVGDTVPVGAYPQNASPYGALDMVGNVRQLVNDFYLKLYYPKSPYYNPTGPSEDQDKGHLARGGGWYDYPRRATTWVRHDEGDMADYDTIGLRCARSLGISGTPTPTPIPTPMPTPTPFAAAEIGPEGGLLWLSYPKHLTLLQIPSGAVSATTAFELVYDGRPGAQGDLQGLNHFFTLGITPSLNVNYPLPLILGYDETLGVIKDTIRFYRLEGSTWVTSGITVSGQGTLLLDQSLVWVKEPGVYGLLGRTNRIYLPVVIKR